MVLVFLLHCSSSIIFWFHTQFTITEITKLLNISNINYHITVQIGDKIEPF